MSVLTDKLIDRIYLLRAALRKTGAKGSKAVADIANKALAADEALSGARLEDTLTHVAGENERVEPDPIKEALARSGAGKKRRILA